MWEIIRANRRKSIILFVCMGTCLILLGYFVGTIFFPPNGGIIGMIIALCVWLIMSVVSYSAGSSILLSISKAKEVSYDIHPQLFNIVEEMKIAANLPHIPKIYIIPDPAPNAFATGIKPGKTAIVVTAGLLSKLNRDELQGVIAHEMSHVVNRDVLFMTFAGILLGSIVLVSEVFLRSMWFSSGSSRRYRSSSSSKGGGQAQIVIVVVAIVLAILAPIIARLLYFAMSRKREYLADASAVRLTRYPEGLASALEKISGAELNLASANKVTAPMYIINPLKKKGRKLSNITSTHPPTSERISILRGMQHGVNYASYQEAFASAGGRSTSIMPPSALRDAEEISIRTPSAKEQRRRSSKAKARDVGDLIRAVNRYVFISCICGLKIKIPPDFKNKVITCPRCDRQHKVPLAEITAAATVLGTAALASEKKTSEAKRPQVYTRKGEGWETFSCACGKAIQLSPSFTALHIACTACSARIEIKK